MILLQEGQLKSLYTIKSNIFNMIFQKISSGKVITNKSKDSLILCRIFSTRQILISKSETFLFLEEVKNTSLRDMHLVHADINQNILFKYLLAKKKNGFPQMIMISEDQVILTDCYWNKLIHIDLTTHQLSSFQHQFIVNQQDFIKIHHFSETNLLCVEEKVYNNDRLKLTYYCLPLTLQAEPVAIYESKEKEFSFDEMKVIKANNHSMMVWFDEVIQSYFNFHIFDLRDIPNGNYQQIIAKYSVFVQFLSQQKPFKNVYRRYANVWQNKRGQFFLLYTYQRNLDTDIRILRLKIDMKCIYESKIILDFPFPDKQLNFSKNFGDFFILSVQEQRAVSQYFFINNESEEIYRSTIRKPDKFKYKYSFPSFNDRLMNKIFYVSTKSLGIYQMSIISTSIYSLQELELHLLLYLNEDFDEDLLKDAVELIDYRKQEMIDV